MKRTILWAPVAACIIIVILVTCGPFVRAIARRQIGAICKDAQVTVGAVSLNPFSRLTLSDIRISLPKVYEVAIGRVSVAFSPVSLLSGLIDTVALHEVRVGITAPHQNILQLKDYFSLGSSSRTFRVLRCALSGLKADIRTADFSLEASASCRISLSKRLVSSLTLSITSCESQGLKAEDLSLFLKDSQGDLHIRKILYNKLVLEEISGRVVIRDTRITVSPLFAKVLNGSIQAPLQLDVGTPFGYGLTLNASGIDLKRIVDDLDLKEKFQLDGTLNGILEVQGSGDEFRVLKGDFDTALPGGRLTITDTRFLEDIARRTQQSMDMVTESFKDYRYKNGTMHVALSDKDVAVDIMFSGESGKRTLNITLHDFSLWVLMQSFKK